MVSSIPCRWRCKKRERLHFWVKKTFWSHSEDVLFHLICQYFIMSVSKLCVCPIKIHLQPPLKDMSTRRSLSKIWILLVKKEKNVHLVVNQDRNGCPFFLRCPYIRINYWKYHFTLTQFPKNYEDFTFFCPLTVAKH